MNEQDYEALRHTNTSTSHTDVGPYSNNGISFTNVMNRILKIIGYLVEVDRGLTNYDTDYLKRELEDLRKELNYD